MKIDRLKTPKENLIDLVNEANATTLHPDDYEFSEPRIWIPPVGISEANTAIDVIALPTSGYLEQQSVYYQRLGIDWIRPEEFLTVIYQHEDDEDPPTMESILDAMSERLALCEQPLYVVEPWPVLLPGEQAFLTLRVSDLDLLYIGSRPLKLKRLLAEEDSTLYDATAYF